MYENALGMDACSVKKRNQRPRICRVSQVYMSIARQLGVEEKSECRWASSYCKRARGYRGSSLAVVKQDVPFIRSAFSDLFVHSTSKLYWNIVRMNPSRRLWCLMCMCTSQRLSRSLRDSRLFAAMMHHFTLGSRANMITLPHTFHDSCHFAHLN